MLAHCSTGTIPHLLFGDIRRFPRRPPGRRAATDWNPARKRPAPQERNVAPDVHPGTGIRGGATIGARSGVLTPSTEETTTMQPADPVKPGEVAMFLIGLSPILGILFVLAVVIPRFLP